MCLVIFISFMNFKCLQPYYLSKSHLAQKTLLLQHTCKSAYVTEDVLLQSICSFSITYSIGGVS